MKLRTKIFAIVATFAIVGMAMFTMVYAAPAPQTEPQSQVTEVNSTTMNLSVVAWAMVDGKKVPLAEAGVIIFSVSVSNDGNGNITIVLHKVAEERTNHNGLAVFHLDQGKYLIFVKYHDLKGHKLVKLDSNQIKFVRLF